MDRYDVYDKNNNVVYIIKRETYKISATFNLFDAHTNKLLFTIYRKFFSLAPTYYICQDDFIHSEITKGFLFFDNNVKLNSIQGRYKITGDLWGIGFKIYQGNNFLGSIKKLVFNFKEIYVLSFDDESTAPLFTALIIAIDNCIYNK
jgi:uncharacterized protein YxjI